MKNHSQENQFPGYLNLNTRVESYFSPLNVFNPKKGNYDFRISYKIMFNMTYKNIWADSFSCFEQFSISSLTLNLLKN